MIDKKSQLEHIEKNHLEHFLYLPKRLGFSVYDLDGIAIINCGLTTSMFNIAYGAPKGGDYQDVITNVIDTFKSQPFAWWIPDGQCNDQLTECLLAKGLKIETTEHAMICDLQSIQIEKPKTAMVIKRILDKNQLSDFMAILEPYDKHVTDFYMRMVDADFQTSEKLFVGYVSNKPVTISILYENNERAGIFSLITDERSRGHGYGSDMMKYQMLYAKQNQCQYLTLSASSDAGYSIYKRLGFKKIGQFECFEFLGNVT